MTRRRAVLLVLVLGVAGLVTGALPWARAALEDPLGAPVAVEAGGRLVAPGVTAGAVVVVAAGLALTLAGRRARVVVVLAVAAGGLLVAGSALAVVVAPDGVGRAVRTAARTAVGVDSLTTAPALTPAPWAALVVGVLTVVAAAVVAGAGRRWPADRRHVRPAVAPEAEPDRPDQPDAPTTGPDDGGRAQPGDDADEERETWDRLSRGEDPT